MKPVDLLDRALDAAVPGAPAPASVRELLDVASEVADALRAVRLDAGDRERLYARSLGLLEDALRGRRRGRPRALRLHRSTPALLGGVALTIGAAAIGWALLHGRRAPARPLAA